MPWGCGAGVRGLVLAALSETVWSGPALCLIFLLLVQFSRLRERELAFSLRRVLPCVGLGWSRERDEAGAFRMQLFRVYICLVSLHCTRPPSSRSSAHSTSTHHRTLTPPHYCTLPYPSSYPTSHPASRILLAFDSPHISHPTPPLPPPWRDKRP